MNFNNVSDALTGAVGAWEWMTSLKPMYYIIIIGVLLALTIGLIIFAAAKKARVRHNDVNVLLMLGDNEESVDASIFKKHYAMVLVSKTDSASVAEPRLLQPLVQLTDSAEEIIERDNVIDEEVAEDLSGGEEVVIENTVVDEFEEEFTVNKESEIIAEPVEDESDYSDEMAVDVNEEEIPFAESADAAEEAAFDNIEHEEETENTEGIVAAEEIDEIAEEEIDEITEEEPIEDIVEEEIDEIAPIEETPSEPVEIEDVKEESTDAANEFAVEEIESADTEATEEICEEIAAEDESEVEIIDNLETAAPIVIKPLVEKTADKNKSDVNKNSVTLYDIDNSEHGAGDRIEVVTYIRDNGICTGNSELIEEETPIESMASEEAAFEETEPEIIEEVMRVDSGEPLPEVAFIETAETEVVEETESTNQIVEEETAESEETPSEEVNEEIIDNTVADEVAAAAAENIEADDSINELELQEVKTDDELAYTLVNVENAVPEAVEAAESGELVVDADGDGVAEEVLVDKNILKSRYKTVDLETRLRRTEESVKGFYSEIKNFLLSYNGVKSRVSKKFDTFTIGRFIVAKMALRGNVINLYLALASESVEDKYFAEDVGDSETYGKTPTLHKVKSKRGCKYGIELIRDIMSELQIPVNDKYVSTDYVALYPPENIEEKKNEIRHLFKDSVSVEDLGVMTDEESMEFIEIVKNKEYTINKFLPINKYVIFVDDLDKLYDNGETVTINDLINKEALPKEENIFLEIRARGTLSRQLTVEAHSFDPNAIKMIILTDGKVIQYK